MSTRLTPVSVADREIKRWREREQKLHDQLYEVQERVEQWVRVRDELREQARAEDAEAVVS
jgi:predicted  nucleic acid-binding Zn-ribbon protein